MSLISRFATTVQAVLRLNNGTRANAARVDPSDAHETGRGAAAGARPAWRRWLTRTLAICVAGWLALVAVLAVYTVIDPWRSNLMLARAWGGTKLQHRWVDMRDISPNLIHAVVPSEDARFCTHWGVDIKEIQNAIARADDRGPRGASTISMQTAKNMFLWSARSYVRKAIELPLALTMDLVWSKRRMLEIYLNFAEWGPGVFGVEAASRFHFGISAKQLSARQAAQLVAALPNPFKRRAGRPGPKTRAYARTVRKRMASGPALTKCVTGTSAPVRS